MGKVNVRIIIALFIFSYYPQQLIHFQCGNGADLPCLTGEGACKKRQLRHHIGKVRQSGSTNTWVTVTTGCACEVIGGSLFQMFC